MLLEVLSEGDEFEVYNPNEIVVCVHGWNATANIITKEKVNLSSNRLTSPSSLLVHHFYWRNTLARSTQFPLMANMVPRSGSCMMLWKRLKLRFG